MEKTKPRLLVVGDSFFSVDSKFPGQHWSEMLPDYEVINHAYLELQTAFPVFHVPDSEWQSNFANEVITKLKMLDI